MRCLAGREFLTDGYKLDPRQVVSARYPLATSFRLLTSLFESGYGRRGTDEGKSQESFVELLLLMLLAAWLLVGY